MKTRTWLETLAVLGFAAAVISTASARPFAGTGGGNAAVAPHGAAAPAPSAPLKPPGQGSIPVAFLLSEGAVVIDFTGPWEVFQDASVPGRADAPFELYTVAETTKPIHASSGLTIVPDYTFDNAPAPKIVVIPAQSTRSEAALAWIRKSSEKADLTMSVCTGAFLLAKTGLLSGKPATTHHSGFRELAMGYPDIQVRRGARGIDLALRVVGRYFGREAAVETAFQMEYQGQGWMNPDSNQVYAEQRVSTDDSPLCPVCDMQVDARTAGIAKSVYKGKSYFFCSAEHKQKFDQAPDTFIASAGKP